MKHLTVIAAFAAAWILPQANAFAQTSTRDPGIATNLVTPARSYDQREYLEGFWRLSFVSKDYEFGAGDRIQIGVFGAPDLSRILQSITIPQSGVLALPVIGEVQAIGLTAEALEAEVGGRLTRQGLLERPEVLVTVIEYQAKPIYVIGEVDNPGQYVMSQPWTLTEAILVAGGLDMTAGKFGYLHRRLSPDATPMVPRSGTLTDPETPRPGYEVTKIDLQTMKDGGILEPDPVLEVGDVVVVPASKSEMAYVIGDVLNRGGIVLPASGTLPVSRALAAAGPTRTAKPSKGIVVRYEPSGARKEIAVDFLAILEGRKPDFEIRPNDVIFIPGSNAKTLGYGLLSAVPNILTNYTVIAVF